MAFRLLGRLDVPFVNLSGGVLFFRLFPIDFRRSNRIDHPDAPSFRLNPSLSGIKESLGGISILGGRVPLLAGPSSYFVSGNRDRVFPPLSFSILPRHPSVLHPFGGGIVLDLSTPRVGGKDRSRRPSLL